MDIPGYKWDRTRKRYFKILKTGELPTSNYTVSALANRDVESKRALARQEDGSSSREEMIQNRAVLRLGKRSRPCYRGGPTEIISSFTLTQNGPLTGSRDGTLTLGDWRSGPGRSIVDVCTVQDRGAVSAVDNDAGTFVCYASKSLRLKTQFVTQLLDVGGERQVSIGIASQQGLTVWDPVRGSLDVLSIGSLSALSRYSGSVVATGARNGALKLADLRAQSDVASGTLGTGMVTHVAGLPGKHAVLAAGLEDQMMLYDVRNSVRPLCQYHGYENWSTSSHGLALSPDGESVAVAMDSGVVAVFDVASGVLAKKLYQDNTGRLASKRAAKAAVTCMRWVNEGLVMATGNKLRAFPSSMRVQSSVSPALADELAVMHSNINLQVKS